MVSKQLIGITVACLLLLSIFSLPASPKVSTVSTSGNMAVPGQSAASNASVLLQFPGDSYYWYYGNSALYGNAFNLTLGAAGYFGMTVNYSSSSYGIYVNAIGAFWNSNSSSGAGPYWLLWIWNSSASAWSLSSLGASAVNLTSKTSVAWTYSMWNVVTGGPYYPPVQTPVAPFAVASSRGSSDGSGFSPVYTNLPARSPSPHLSWSAGTARGGLDVQPVDSGGMAYFVSDGTNGTSSVLAYSQYGVRIWNSTIGSQGYEVASPLVADGQLIVPSTDGNLYSLNSANGKLLYIVKHLSSAADGLTTAPVLGPSGFFLMNCSGGVDYFAFNGSILWNAALPAWSNFTSPAYSQGMLYIFSQHTNDSVLTVLDAATGSAVWNRTYSGLVFGTPAVTEGRICFITSVPANPGYGDVTVHSVLSSNRSPAWNYSAGSSSGAPSSASVADGRVIFGAGDHIFELNSTNGKLVWEMQDNNQFASPSPFVFNNNIIYSTNSNNSELSVVSIGGVPLWNYTTRGGSDYSLSSPIFNGSSVLWGDDLGNIYSFQELQIVNFSYTQYRGTINLTAILQPGLSNATFAWKVGNHTGAGPVDSVPFVANGTYPVTLTVSYSEGTVASITGNVTVDSVQSNSTNTAGTQPHNSSLQFFEYGAAAAVVAAALIALIAARRRRRK